ncbi:MAG: selenium cofactor biosynthesis protein YqeC [Acidimicrobiales bacterium]|jgi:probable selenium-dependent hydroxylase accessory protein YqeC
MRVSDAIGLLLPSSGAVVAVVGAGGKTTVLFELGEDLARRGADTLVTTTTAIFDPRGEPGRPFDEVLLEADMAHPFQDHGEIRACCTRQASLEKRGRLIVLASRAEPGGGKLEGIHPSWPARLSRAWAYVLVEADGAKRRSIKAPGEHEPVVPPSTDVVIGVVGLDCVGRSMDAATVHRPERFQAVTGCPMGAPVQLAHVATLVRAPKGLFKSAPPGSRRIVLLNKADRCVLPAAEVLGQILASGAIEADLIIVCSHDGSNSPGRVLMLAPASGLGTRVAVGASRVAEKSMAPIVGFGASQ